MGSAARGVLNHISFVLERKKIGVAVLVLPSIVGKGIKTMRVDTLARQTKKFTLLLRLKAFC